ncbi:hypothetical protein TNCV_3179571 [Trichonephila clavipes]|nr:hypothetical protein TNCV_3179571 [Trichonephila clavipes]
MSLSRNQKQYEQLSEFLRERITETIETEWLAWSVSRHVDLTGVTVRKGWMNWIRKRIHNHDVHLRQDVLSPGSLLRDSCLAATTAYTDIDIFLPWLPFGVLWTQSNCTAAELNQVIFPVTQIRVM